MWKLKLTYFYVKFFYSLIFNKLWKPGVLMFECVSFTGKGLLLWAHILELSKLGQEKLSCNWFSKFRT